MKKLYKEQIHSLYEIQKKLGLSFMTLYSYVNKRSIDSMAIGTFIKMAQYEEREPMELYVLIKGEENAKNKKAK